MELVDRELIDKQMELLVDTVREVLGPRLSAKSQQICGPNGPTASIFYGI